MSFRVKVWVVLGSMGAAAAAQPTSLMRYDGNAVRVIAEGDDGFQFGIHNPQVSGDRVYWIVGGGPAPVMVHDGLGTRAVVSGELGTPGAVYDGELVGWYNESGLHVKNIETGERRVLAPSIPPAGIDFFAVSRGHVAWREPGDRMMVNDGTSTRRLNAGEDLGQVGWLALRGDDVAWRTMGRFGADSVRWNERVVMTLGAESGLSVGRTAAGDGFVAWTTHRRSSSGGRDDSTVWRHDGETLAAVGVGGDVVASDSHMAWVNGEGIWLMSGAGPELVWGDEGYAVDELSISSEGADLTWSAWDGNDHEIFLYRGGVVRQLTDNGYEDRAPSVDRGTVVWVAVPEAGGVGVIGVVAVGLLGRRERRDGMLRRREVSSDH